MPDNRDLLTNTLLIGDRMLDCGSEGTMEHLYPATGEVNGIVTLGGASEIGEAVERAKAAAPVWEAMGPIGRRDCLGRLANIIEAKHGDFKRLVAAELGQPQQSFAGRHGFAVQWVRTYQGWADKIGGDLTVSSDSGDLQYTRFEPYGVVGIIITWNSPLLSLAMKVPPALAAGNTVVVKPSEFTPYTPVLFGQACLEAGIPPGVVNIVSGGRAAGEALVAHEDVEKISFTGGVATAAAMMRSGSPLIKPFCFELGGKSAHIVFADADIASAAKVAAAGLSNAGQSCTFGSRVFVHDTVYEAFRTAFVEAVGRFVPGDPEDSRTSMGPLISAGARDRVLSIVQTAVDHRHGRVLCGGKAPRFEGALDGGYFVEPTIFEDVDVEAPLSREEIFGPVFCLFRFTDEADVISTVNATRFGLSNYVHTLNVKRALRVASQLKSGTVYVNDVKRGNPAATFAGFRQSGIGYEGGRPGLDEYLRKKAVGLA